jgi:hypothetical protein
MTDTKIHIKPAPGKVVIDPETRKSLAADGDTVTSSTYWLRRVADGDVIQLDAPSPKPKTKRAAPTAEEPRSAT